MTANLDPVSKLRGEVMQLRGALELMDRSDTKAIRKINDKANRTEQNAYKVLGQIGKQARKGKLGAPITSENRYSRVDTISGLIKDIVEAKTNIRVMAKEFSVTRGGEADDLLSYDISESWKHWGARMFLGKPVKFVAYTIPKTVVYSIPKALSGQIGLTHTLTSGAIIAAGVYGTVTGDYKVAMGIGSGALLTDGMVHLINAGCQTLKGNFS